MKKFILQFTLLVTSFMFAQTDPNAFIIKYKTEAKRLKAIIEIDDKFAGYDFNVNWGDGTTDTNITDDVTHEYATVREFTVSITGVYPALELGGKSTGAPVISVEQWGTNEWLSGEKMFAFIKEFKTINATDIPNFSKATSLKAMFFSCKEFNSDISKWDVSTIKDFSDMFLKTEKFNSPLNDWDVSSAIFMERMFFSSDIFNQPLNDWDVSNVTNMASMFKATIGFSGPSEFNQPLDKWDVSNVTNMRSMFEGADKFNQPLNSWNVSKVTITSDMFSGALKFNQPLDKWDVSNVEVMGGMFAGAESFNQSLNSWNVGKVTEMSSMFSGAKEFNQPLNNWDVSKVISMGGMFSNAEVFNQNINTWDTSSVEELSYIFAEAKAFNQPLDNWDLSNISSVEHDGVFRGATSFDQPLENWYPRQGSGVKNMRLFLSESGMSSENYTKTLIAWSKAPDIIDDSAVEFGLNLEAKGVDYCDEAISAIEILENDLNWFIEHGDIDPDCSGPTLSTNDFSTIADNDTTMYFDYQTNSIAIQTETKAALTVYDLFGREVIVKQIASGISSENLSSLQPALYIVKLKNNGVAGKDKLLKVILN
ncbi:BspA family leucine-rich repeat surface protein [Aquimarina agarilytica]|uniref:BspA family leucine-rich repeat surface protein n=1 Tax=Aquimarina agarilytica TaxID=1087449 RepID=UPI000287B1D4|nr:BspA family leucine-rich repeat surface protein [Aquimarina agarilytica]